MGDELHKDVALEMSIVDDKREISLLMSEKESLEQSIERLVAIKNTVEKYGVCRATMETVDPNSELVNLGLVPSYENLSVTPVKDGNATLILEGVVEAILAVEKSIEIINTKLSDKISTMPEFYQDELKKAAEKDDDEGGKYGDVEYADEKNKKYPIDTEKHVRAAWSYICMKRNAAKYTEDELKTIKSRIKKAAKKFGIEINEDGKLELSQEGLLSNSLSSDSCN